MDGAADPPAGTWLDGGKRNAEIPARLHRTRQRCPPRGWTAGNAAAETGKGREHRSRKPRRPRGIEQTPQGAPMRLPAIRNGAASIKFDVN